VLDDGWWQEISGSGDSALQVRRTKGREVVVACWVYMWRSQGSGLGPFFGLNGPGNESSIVVLP